MHVNLHVKHFFSPLIRISVKTNIKDLSEELFILMVGVIIQFKTKLATMLKCLCVCARCVCLCVCEGERDQRRPCIYSSYLSSDPRRMWGGLRHITGYKGRNSSDDQPAASLPDDLNTFYARFEATNTLPSARLAEDQDDYTPSLTVAHVRRELQRMSGWSSRPHPQGVRRPIHLHIQPLPISVFIYI